MLYCIVSIVLVDVMKGSICDGRLKSFHYDYNISCNVISFRVSVVNLWTNLKHYQYMTMSPHQ